MKKLLLLLSSLFIGLTLNAQVEDFEILDDPAANGLTADWTYNGSSINWHLDKAGGAYKVSNEGYSPISDDKSLRLRRNGGYIETNDVLLDIGEVIHTVSFLVKHSGGTVTEDPHDFELTVYSTTADQGVTGLITTVTKSTGSTADTQILTFSGLTIPQNSRIRIKNSTTLSKGHVLIDDITLNADAILSNKEFNKNIGSISPNPFKDNLNIKLKESNKFSFQIINLVGQVMYTSATYKDNANVSISNLSKGVYVLKINTEGTSYSKRIIKN
tara:strand:- start:20331 stop:21146 length:816 start_codon:yes stop_codon:yes gene_type:complete